MLFQPSDAAGAFSNSKERADLPLYDVQITMLTAFPDKQC